MSTYRVRLLDYNEYSEYTNFGTCELCMHSGIAENPTFTFEYTDTDTGEKTVDDVKGYMWSWGDYITVYIYNVPLFGDWLEDNTVTVSTKNMDYGDLQELADRFEIRQHMDARDTEENE